MCVPKIAASTVRLITPIKYLKSTPTIAQWTLDNVKLPETGS